MSIKPRGRPRLAAGAASVPVMVRVTPGQYDAMYKAASRERLTVTEWMRRNTRPKTERTE